ncbi:hypothetical protein RJ640_019919 [Escallonia rubra]|uniref:Mitochondrial import inner membrane translocase subunit TIM22 n=1 Tax=Escallonia rubra TaxID=112253 RepID=A0AA88RRI8_9ASTE|nr:hypothetical protein RJ640_019920 [Escallonia rubra]KAK2990639.1 hypothetical protein RJ640_019919 [Escallonia rubra]
MPTDLIPRAICTEHSPHFTSTWCIDGLFGGIFALTHCGMQRYRRQNDWVNGLIAGAVGGAAFAVGTRNWKQVVGMASVFSAFAAAADYSVSNSMHLN